MSNPEHEYTKLLVASVPVADPDRRWRDRVELINGRPTLMTGADDGPAGPNPGSTGPANGKEATSPPETTSPGTPGPTEIPSVRLPE